MSERAALGNAALSLLTYLLTYLSLFAFFLSLSLSYFYFYLYFYLYFCFCFYLAPTPVWLLLPKADRGNPPIFLL